MAVPARRASRWPVAFGGLLPLALAVILLIPVVLLFGQARSANDDRRDLATRERLGVEYLRALGPVTNALVDAQSAAVTGRPASQDAVTQAVEQAASIDSRLGQQLRSHERWAGLRAKLEGLPERGLANPEQAFTAYVEVTDLLLALYRKVAESSGLVRDPAADSYFLQDSAADELPGAVIAAGRLADLAVLASARPSRDRLRSVAELSAARVATLSPAAELVGNLRGAVDSTESSTLGGNVLSPFDAYQRAVETLAAASVLTGQATNGQLPIDAAQLAAARLNAQSAAQRLSPVILTELDNLISTRIDTIDDDRWLSVGIFAAAVLLLLALAATVFLAGRRHRGAGGTDPTTEVPGTGGPDGADQPAHARWPGSPGRAEHRQHRRTTADQLSPLGATSAPGPGPFPPAGIGQLPAAGYGQLQPAGERSDGEPTRWGPFDAAR